MLRKGHFAFACLAKEKIVSTSIMIHVKECGACYDTEEHMRHVNFVAMSTNVSLFVRYCTARCSGTGVTDDRDSSRLWAASA